MLDSSVLERVDPHWLDGPEGSSSTWGTLPHGLFGATPAGPCVSRIKAKRGSKIKGQTPRTRAYRAVRAAELGAALDAKHFDPDLCPIPLVREGSPAEVKRRVRPTKRAEVLEPEQVEQVLAHIERYSRSPESDRLKVLLSHYAGLRSCEIAGLTIGNCADVEGRIGKKIVVGSHISKSRDLREIPLNRRIAEALAVLRKRYPEAKQVAFSVGRGGRIRPQNAAAVTSFFYRLYKDAGFEGCSSHSGRRSFATRLARRMPASDASLYNLKKWMGHRRLSSTECYLEPSPEAAELVYAL